MEKVGFIGLGVMGLPMCKNLIKAGFRVTVWNRTITKTNEVASLGATVASSPKEVAEKSDVVLTMVGDSPDVEDVVIGHLGIIEGARSGLIVIDMSSISPGAARRIAQRLEKAGVEFLDAPVSGGEIGAREGTLSIMVGGSECVFKKCIPIFRAVGKTITYMGETGLGQATKLCNQVICGMHIQAVCEGLILGRGLGLDLKRLLEILTGGYANSRILSDLGPRMIKHDFKPGTKIRYQIKDLRNALSTAAELNLPLPCTSLTYALFQALSAEGLDESASSAAILVMEKLTERKLIEAASE